MSAPVNKSAVIVELLKTRFAAIVAGSSYNYTYSGLVFTNATAPIDEGININKGNEDLLFKDSSATFEYCKAPVTIDVVTKNNLKDPDLVVADIQKSIGTDTTVSSNAIGIVYLNTQSDVPDQQGNLIAVRRINIEIFFRKTIWST